jgi:carbon storage regulator
MLLLTRKPKESIIVGDVNPVVVTVWSVNGNQVRIGITADQNVAIYRQEIYQKIKIKNDMKSEFHPAEDVVQIIE